MELATIIQILIGLIVTIIMAVVTTARSESQKDRTEILRKLDELGAKHYEIETRLTVLERDFMDIDPHPSRPRRP